MVSKEVLAVLGVVFLLAPVVFVSGCVGGGDLFSIFSSFGNQQVEVAPPDVLVVQNAQVIPNSPITADSPFTLTFQVVNIGETEQGAKEARNVNIFVYDWGKCHPQGTIDPDGKFYSGSPVKIYPGGGAELAQFKFKAPTNEELGYMAGKCTIRYAVLYQYDAYTTSDVVVISNERLEQVSKSGETLEINPVQTQSRGPLKISVDFEVNQPVSEGSVIPAIIKVRDEGSGMYEKVNAGDLEVDFSGMELIGGDCNPSLANEMPLIKKETPPIRCDLRVNSVEDIKTFNVKANILDYWYPLYGEMDVKVNPTYEA